MFCETRTLLFRFSRSFSSLLAGHCSKIFLHTSETNGFHFYKGRFFADAWRRRSFRREDDWRGWVDHENSPESETEGTEVYRPSWALGGLNTRMTACTVFDTNPSDVVRVYGTFFHVRRWGLVREPHSFILHISTRVNAINKSLDWTGATSVSLSQVWSRFVTVWTAMRARVCQWAWWWAWWERKRWRRCWWWKTPQSRGCTPREDGIWTTWRSEK